MNKVKYLADCIQKNTNSKYFVCPSCGCQASSIVSRKYLVTTLRRCDHCQLLFRTPTTGFEENATFYQEDYAEGFTTDCPTDELLSKYLETSFQGTEKDYSSYIEILHTAGVSPGNRVFDFGCSWGYGSWQLVQAGFDVECYEISKPRARFAQDKLDLKVYSSLANIQPGFDVFFSAHVLEHVPSVKETIEFAMALLKPKGLFIAFTPNGSVEYRKRDQESWNKLWGMVHPNFLDDRFYRSSFASHFPFIASSPYSVEQIRQWRDYGEFDGTKVPMDGDELLVMVRK
jgi:2-polyprenyl-3-methyl-5-hydroxy-6-metoxy-1,4-benzoquinol methylase